MKLINSLIFTLILAVAGFGSVTVIAPKTTADENAKVTVPITVTGASDIIAFQFNIDYDPAVLTPAGSNYGCSTGALAYPMTTLCNVTPDGTLHVVVYGSTTFWGSGTVLNVKFYTHTGASGLTFSNVYFFDEGGSTPVTSCDGELDLE